jgi:hypothetical protein
MIFTVTSITHTQQDAEHSHENLSSDCHRASRSENPGLIYSHNGSLSQESNTTFHSYLLVQFSRRFKHLNMFLDKFPYRKMPDNSNECIN